MGGVEEWRIKLTSAKVEVEVQAELGNNVLFQLISKSAKNVQFASKHS